MSALDEILGPPLAWPTELGDYLSASRLNKFATCPESFRRRYVLGEMEPSNPNLVWGSADSYAAQVNYAQKIDSHEDLPVGDVKEAFAAGFDNAVNQAAEMDWEGEQRGEILDAGVKLAAAYHEQIAPLVQPIAVEERVELEVPGVPVPLIGFFDLAEAEHTIERKTSGRKAVVVQPQWRIQGLVYQLARHQPVHYHVGVKTKTPAVYTSHTEPGLVIAGPEAIAERVIVGLVDQLLATWDRFGPDDTWPGNITHTWACDLCLHGPKRRSDCRWWS